MNRKARKTLATLTLLLIIGLIAYTGAWVSSAHDRAASRADRVVDLGTILVTPYDTPARAAMAAKAERYASRKGSRDYDGSRGL